jgi:hypothetical protein
LKRLLAAVALVALTATGCGGASAKTAVRAPSPSLSVPALPTDLPTNVPSAAASILAGLASTQCQDIAKQFSSVGSAFSGAAAGTIDQTFAALATVMKNAASKVDKPDIKAALQTLAKGYATLATKLKGVTYTPGPGKTPPPAFLAAAQSLSAPEYAAASLKLNAYFSSGCK